MNQYNIKPSTLSGSITAPPSKSHSLRAILFASLATGKSIIRNCLVSPDVNAMIAACVHLGAQISQNADQIEVIGVSGKPRRPDDVINAGNSGQVLRFVAAIAGLIDGYTVITGDASIRYNRPLKPLIDGLTQLGAQCICTKGDDRAPLIIHGPIKAGHIFVDGEDSQPISGLLIACAFADGTTTLEVRNPGEKPWVGLTLNWFDRLGIQYTNDNFKYYRIEGNHIINGFEYTVPGDFSSIAYPIVAALITHTELSIKNITMDDVQGDKKIIDVLIRMGADITIKDDELTVKPCGTLQGCEIDINDFIDAITILAVVGCYATATTTITNAAIARLKESDRISTICQELQKMGARINETDDGLIIHHSTLHGATVESHADHRIAMSLAVAALGASSPTTINNVACVAKSYARFYHDMQSLGCQIEEIA